MGHLFNYHVYSQSYGYENIKNGYFSADDRKNFPVWAKYLSSPKRS